MKYLNASRVPTHYPVSSYAGSLQLCAPPLRKVKTSHSMKI